MSRRALEKKVENEIFAKQAKTVAEFLKKNNASKVAACQMKESEAETEVYAREKAQKKAQNTSNDDEYEKVYKQIFSESYFRTLEGVYLAAYEEAAEREYIDTCYVSYTPQNPGLNHSSLYTTTTKTPSPDRMDWQRTPSSGNLDNRVVPLRQFSGDIGSGSNPLRQLSGSFSPRKIKRKSPSRKSPSRKSPKRKSQLPCRPDQVRNRSTGRCRKTPCRLGKIRDVTSGRCRSKKTSGRKSKSPSRKSSPKRKSIKPCRQDQVRNRSTGRCRRSKKLSANAYAPKRKHEDELDLSSLAWKDAANIEYDSKKKTQKYQLYVKKNKAWIDEEQAWVDDFLTPLIDFMGDETVWKYIVPNIILLGVGGRASVRSGRTAKNLKHPLGIYTGSHWLAYKQDDTFEFDPYREYQISGTNQFCQTFSMMYLCDQLPDIETHPWKKFYVYTVKALEFIKKVINKVVKQKGLDKKTAKELLRCVNECLTYPNICVNAVELPSF